MILFLIPISETIRPIFTFSSASALILFSELNLLSDNFKNEKLFKIVDSINNDMGNNTIKFLSQGLQKKITKKQNNLSPSYTTKWSELLKVYCN